MLESQTCNFIKQRLQHRCFPVKFCKFLRTRIWGNICEWQLLLFQASLKDSSYLSISVMTVMGYWNTERSGRPVGLLLKAGPGPWTWTLDSDPEKPGLWKTWTLKNMDPEKPGPWKAWTQKNLDPEKPRPWKSWLRKTWNMKNVENRWMQKKDWKTT